MTLKRTDSGDFVNMIKLEGANKTGDFIWTKYFF